MPGPRATIGVRVNRPVPFHILLRCCSAGLYSVFKSAEELQKYAVSEAHVKVVNENVRPNVDGEYEHSKSQGGVSDMAPCVTQTCLRTTLRSRTRRRYKGTDGCATLILSWATPRFDGHTIDTNSYINDVRIWCR